MNFGQTVKDEIYARPVRDELVPFRIAGVLFAAESAGMFVTTSKELVDFIQQNLELRIESLGGKYLCEIKNTEKINMSNLSAVQLKEFAAGVFLASARTAILLENQRRRSGYHIEFAFEKADNAREFCEILAGFEILPKLTERNGKSVIYIKSSDCICNLLAMIGATRSLLALNNEIAVRELRNTSNRRVNCDTYNINKQVEAGRIQADAIRKMDADGRLMGLDTKLREVAEARLANPDMNLEELAQILGLTKSCVVHRLRKLMEA